MLNSTSLVRWMKGHGSWMVTGPTRLYKGYFTGNNFPWAHRGRCARDRPRSARPPPSQGGRTRPGNTCGEIVPTDEKSIWTMNRKDINGVYIILPFAKKRDRFVWRWFVTLSLFRVFRNFFLTMWGMFSKFSRISQYSIIENMSSITLRKILGIN